MTIDEAAKILEVAPDATPEQLETRFNELRARLEDKIAKAPTPGLREKYRNALAVVCEAHDTLAQSGDSADLPLLARPLSTRVAPMAAAAPMPVPSPGLPPESRSAAASAAVWWRERQPLLIGAVVIAVLAVAGAWWAMKTGPGDLEERAPDAAAVAGAAEAPEAGREEAEKAALISLRAQQAEAKGRWEILERELSAAERTANELRADLRSAHDRAGPKMAELQARSTAQERFLEWLQPYILRHPAKTELARLEASLSAGRAEEAAAHGAELAAALTRAEEEVRSQREALLALTRSLEILSEPDGLRFTFTDSWGRTSEGKTPFTVDASPGWAQLRVFPPEAGWAEVTRDLLVNDEIDSPVTTSFPATRAKITSIPEGLSFELSNPYGLAVRGTTPAELESLPAGPVTFWMARPGWPEVRREVELGSGENELTATFAGSELKVDSVPPGAAATLNGRAVGETPFELADLPPGRYEVELTLAGFAPASLEATLSAGGATTLEAPLRRLPPPSPRPGCFWEVPDLDLRFVPVPGTRVLAGTAKLHAGAYAIFAGETRRPAHRQLHAFKKLSWNDLDYVGSTFTHGITPSSPNRPVTVMTWADASAFCEWLTARERSAGRLAPTQRYRLPTSAEWDIFVTGKFSEPLSKNRTPLVWPVGYGAPNEYGLHDLGTFVHEWVEDGGSNGMVRVVRGGAKVGLVSVNIDPRHHAAGDPNFANYLYGFRCVLDAGGEHPPIGSIGAEFDDRLRAGAPVSGSPAERAGLQAGDELIAFNGRNLVPGDPWNAWRMRGPIDSEVHLEVRREGESHYFTLTRASLRR